MREPCGNETSPARGHLTRAVLATMVVAVLTSAFAGSPAWGQLDSTCMVSALNRTAPVDDSGVWLLPNVPADLGPLRVRATCVAPDGTVRSGASASLYTLLANGTVSVKDISFVNPPAVPESLALTSAVSSFGLQGQTAQLTAVATNADGTTTDVSAAGLGTDFRTSNPAIATVDSGGLVTALASGNVIISATNEGALAVLQLQVVLSGSTVGDGIPDDWKIAHGLDPNDPLVAYEDPDNDGLTNLEEYQNGTDPNNPDTDGDGLSDGDEVHLYHTNPLLWDTDGDGISDGVEVRTGSDPLDIHSFNLAAALSSITVAPSSFRLIFNTVSGESSRQLAAVGNVIDGRTIDMFNPLYQTQVTSSDLTIASFGSDPGRVYAGQSGSATVTVSNSGHGGAASVTVQTFSPTAEGFVALTGFADAVEVSGTTAFVASGAAGLYVVDVTDLASPVVVANLALPGNANDVRVAGSVAYVADGGAMLTVDVSDPAHPARLGSVAIAGNAVRLAVSGNLVYVADLAFGLHVVDVSNPSQPSEVGAVALAGEPRAVSLGGPAPGSYAVVACGDAGLSVVDVSTPSAPVVVGTSPAGSLLAGSVTVRSHYAYVATGEAGIYGGLHVIELADPTNPVEVGASQDDLGVNRVALENGFALGSQFFVADQAPIFDIGGLPPVYSSVLDFSTLGTFLVPRGSDIAVRQGAVFVTANSQLADFGSFGEPWGFGSPYTGQPYTGLYTGLYALPVDFGTNPPTVSITAPAAGATVPERVPLTVSVTAQDEVSVTSVAFLVNGTVVETLYKPPYQTQVAVPAGQPTVTLGAVATAISGLQASAANVVLNVQPYPLPVVTLLAPVAGQSLVNGQALRLAALATDTVAVTMVNFYVNGQLLSSVASPPFLATYFTQPADASLTVSAVAYDAGGPGLAASVVVPVNPDQAPAAAVFLPLDGSQVVEGVAVPVLAGASDQAVGIANMIFFLNGAQVAEFVGPTPPYGITFTAPPAGQTTQIHVTATNVLGLQTTTPDVTVTSIADPGTAVLGTVVDPTGAPLGGAVVAVTAQGGASGGATSAADGTFTVAGLPTNQGSFAVSVSATLRGCPAQASATAAVPPAGANVDVGDLTVASTITVAPPTTVVGTVLGLDGQGLAGVTITVSSADLVDTETVTSGAGGAFAAAGFPARTSQVGAEAVVTVGGVMLYGTSGTAATAAAVAGGATALGSIQLQPYPYTGADPLTTIAGQVVNGDGSPAAGALVVIDLGYAQVTAVALADGSFSVSGVPTLAGSVLIGASLTEQCVLNDAGGAIPVEVLVPGGVTAVGVLTIAPPRHIFE
jgi:hypothetical protein